MQARQCTAVHRAFLLTTDCQCSSVTPFRLREAEVASVLHSLQIHGDCLNQLALADFTVCKRVGYGE